MFPFAPAGKTATSVAETADAAEIQARAPSLKDAAERITGALVKNLQKMTGSAGSVDGNVHGLAMRDLREVVSSHGPNGIAALINAAAVPCSMLVTIDSNLVHGLVDLLCGGSGRERPPSIARDATPIDQQFVQIVVTLLAGAITAEWAEYAFGPTSATKIEILTIDVLGPRVIDVGCIELKIAIHGFAGTIRLALPPVALARFAATEAGEGEAIVAPDGAWANLFQRELAQAQVRLDAYLDGKDIDLASLATLKPGQIIALPSDARARASLLAQGQMLFRGEVGQADDRYSLRIDEVVPVSQRSTTVAASASRRTHSEPLRR